MTTTTTVNVTFSLSPAGQRASLIAGGSGAAQQTIAMAAAPADLASERIVIAPDGSALVELERPLDAPPASLAEAVALAEAAAVARQAAAVTRRAEVEAAVAAYEAGGDYPHGFSVSEYHDLLARAMQETERRRAIRDAEFRAARVRRIAALPETATLADIAYISAAREEQVEALGEDRVIALEAAHAELKAAEKAAAELKAAELAADEALPIWHFAVAGSLCGFRSSERVKESGKPLRGWHNGWATYDDRHWLGVFDSARGISRFFDHPHGEKCYSIRGVGSLRPGECIQQASFSVNSRGKRRNECEHFAVVDSVTETVIGIIRCASRAAALQLAAQKHGNAQ